MANKDFFTTNEALVNLLKKNLPAIKKNTNCDHEIEDICAYVDEALHDNQKLEVEDRIFSCDSCFETYSFLQQQLSTTSTSLNSEKGEALTKLLLKESETKAKNIFASIFRNKTIIRYSGLIVAGFAILLYIRVPMEKSIDLSIPSMKTKEQISERSAQFADKVGNSPESLSYNVSKPSLVAPAKKMDQNTLEQKKIPEKTIVNQAKTAIKELINESPINPPALIKNRVEESKPIPKPNVVGKVMTTIQPQKEDSLNATNSSNDLTKDVESKSNKAEFEQDSDSLDKPEMAAPPIPAPYPAKIEQPNAGVMADSKLDRKSVSEPSEVSLAKKEKALGSIGSTNENIHLKIQKSSYLVLQKSETYKETDKTLITLIQGDYSLQIEKNNNSFKVKVLQNNPDKLLLETTLTEEFFIMLYDETSGKGTFDKIKPITLKHLRN